MRRLVPIVAVSVLVLGVADQAYAAPGHDDSGTGKGPVVVASGLDNPRQLSWAGDTLLVAEAGSGGPCTPLPPTDGSAPPAAAPPPPADGPAADELCAGDTGAVTAVDRPDNDGHTSTQRVLQGLFSVQADGSAIGPDGVAPAASGGLTATGLPRRLLIAQGEQSPDALATAPGTDTQEHLLVSIDGHVLP